MTGALYLTTVALHLLAAVVWLGGMFFLALVGAPVLRRVEPADLRRALFEELGRRFRVVGWTTIAVLLATGVLLVHLRGWLFPALDGSLWGTHVGRLLAWKLAAVGAMLATTAVHDLLLEPKLVADEAAALRLRRRSVRFARAAALLGLLVLFYGVRLARGL